MALAESLIEPEALAESTIEPEALAESLPQSISASASGSVLPSIPYSDSALAQTERVDALLQTLLSDESPSKINLDEVRVDPKWSAKVPAPFAIRRKLLPLCCLDGVVRVATSQAIDATIEKQLTSYLGSPFLAIETDAASLQRAITRVVRNARFQLPCRETKELRSYRQRRRAIELQHLFGR